jgi:hypothetical protein
MVGQPHTNPPGQGLARSAKAGSGSALAEHECRPLSHQLKGLSEWLQSGMTDVMLRMTNGDGTLEVLK